MTEHCECPTDGFCQRYKRQMAGRLREICAGENIDPVKAAKYRQQWARDATGSGFDMPLSLAEQAYNLASDSIRWRLAGKPMRTQEEVTRIYNDVCGTCPQLADDKGSCTLCNCRLTPLVEEWNKIALATSHCPAELW